MREPDALGALAAPAASADPLVPLTRPADVRDAGLVHALYLATPSYFEMIAIPVPTSSEVRTEVLAARQDPRRHIELVLGDPGWRARGLVRDARTGRPVAGVLDYKLDYPEPGDATINLLLVHGVLQGRGVGARAVADLERRLGGSTRRVLAAVYGRNPSACGFWEHQGYRFAIDAGPVLDWYAKEIHA